MHSKGNGQQGEKGENICKTTYLMSKYTHQNILIQNIQGTHKTQ